MRPRPCLTGFIGVQPIRKPTIVRGPGAASAYGTLRTSMLRLRASAFRDESDIPDPRFNVR